MSVLIIVIFGAVLFSIVVGLAYISSRQNGEPTAVMVDDYENSTIKSTRSPNARTQPTVSPVTFTKNPSASVIPVPLALKAYTKLDYRIKYPTGWQIVDRPLDNNGSLLIINNDNAKHEIIVQKVPTSKMPVARAEAIYKLQRYTRSVLQINGIRAISYVGLLNIPQKKTQERVVFLEKNGFTYFIRSTYISDIKISENEYIFAQILDSFII